MDERRRFDRKPYTHKVNYSNGKHLHSGIIDNISNSGIFILTREYLSKGTKVVLCIELPGEKALLEGEVVRKNASGIGVWFSELDMLNDLRLDVP